MKKLAAILALMMLAGFAGTSSAATDALANTTKKGSILIFPKIDVRTLGPNDIRDTIIRISNDSTKGVNLDCWYTNSEQDVQGFSIYVPANAAVWFKASNGQASARLWGSVASFPMPVQTDPYTKALYPGTGSLTCVAVDENGTPIKYNQLYGTAEITDLTESVIHYAYPSWNFAAHSESNPNFIGTPGELRLSGDPNSGYDSCASMMTTEFEPGDGVVTGTEMTLVPCIQDNRRNRDPIVTTALFDVWDQNGVKIGQAYKCVNSFFDGYLQNIRGGADPWTGLLVGGYNGQLFKLNNSSTYDNGRVRVSAIASSICESPNYYTFWRDNTFPNPVYGLASAYYNSLGIGPTGSSKTTSFVGLAVKHVGEAGGQAYAKTPAISAANLPGKILYDPTPVSTP